MAGRMEMAVVVVVLTCTAGIHHSQSCHKGSDIPALWRKDETSGVMWQKNPKMLIFITSQNQGDSRLAQVHV